MRHRTFTEEQKRSRRIRRKLTAAENKARERQRLIDQITEFYMGRKAA